MYMANTSPNVRGLNSNYIRLARVGSGRLRVGSTRLRVGSGRLCIDLLDTKMLVSARVGGLEQGVGGLEQRKRGSRCGGI